MQEYDYIASKRIAYFYSSKPRPSQFTVLVRSIPATSGRSFSESVESFFSEYYPSTYLSHSVVRRTSKLKGLIVSKPWCWHFNQLYCEKYMMITLLLAIISFSISLLNFQLLLHILCLSWILEITLYGKSDLY